MQRAVLHEGRRRRAVQGPAYRPIYDKIRDRLTSGDFAAGTLLPTEDQLCEEYKVSRYALREALRLLERQGLIERRRGAGTRVLSPSKTVPSRRW